jgi:capsular polysaccharide biosynthesis protein
MHDLSIKMLRLPMDLNGPRAFTITFTYPDRRLAQAVTRELVANFTAAIPRAGTATSMEILDPASWPMQPIEPHPAEWATIGAGLGLLVGVTVAYALRWRIMIVRRPA